MLLRGCLQYFTACLAGTELSTPVGLTEAGSESSFAGGNVPAVEWAVPNATCVSIALRSGATQVSGISVVDDGRENIFQVCASEAEPAACPKGASRAVWIAADQCTADFALGLEVQGSGCLSRPEGTECIMQPGLMFFLEADDQQCCGPSGWSCNARAPKSWEWTCSDCSPEEPPTEAEEYIGAVLAMIYSAVAAVVLVGLFLVCTRPGHRILALIGLWQCFHKLRRPKPSRLRRAGTPVRLACSPSVTRT